VAVPAIRPGRPWPTQILAWTTQMNFWPTKVWNVYERDVDFRTNNHVEGMKKYCFVGDSYSRANPVEECLSPYSVRQSRPLFYYKLL